MNHISIKGMRCEHCKNAVTEALEELGLQNVEVDLETGAATFAESDLTLAQLQEAIDDAGFEIG